MDSQKRSQKSSNEVKMGGLMVKVLGVVVPVSVVLGAFGGIVAERYVWPLVQSVGVFQDVNFLQGIDAIDGGQTTVVRREETITVEEDSAVIDAVEAVRPAVVSVVTSSNVQDFFGNVSEQRGGGTGFIITADGLIATNKHVIDGVSDDGLRVITSEGEVYDAEVVSIDPSNDFAVIRVEADGLPVAQFGDSDALKVGQRVVAIGNALGQYQNTVTLGVVSAKDRTINAGGNGVVAERLEGVIQTDAAINPGNSGGPLINLNGEVVGVNTAVDGGGQTIGFALPINVLRPAIETVLESGEIVRPFLGVRYLPLTPEIAELNGLSVSRGALIQGDVSSGLLGVVEGSPADDAGLEEGDVILSIGGEDLSESRGLVSLLQRHKPGDEVVVVVLRDGEELSVDVVLGEVG